MKSPALLFLVLLVGCNQTGGDNAEPVTTNEPGHTLESVDDTNFAAAVLKSDQPVMVDFWASWCGPCRELTPIVEELAADFLGRAKVVKLDVDESPETAREYNVTSIPMLLFFKDGEVVNKLVGVQTKSTLAEVLESL